MKESFVHVYTGNGKGKSTAAFGLALRALFAGKKVYIAQFIKDMKYHETGIETVMDGIKSNSLGLAVSLTENLMNMIEKSQLQLYKNAEKFWNPASLMW